MPSNEFFQKGRISKGVDFNNFKKVSGYYTVAITAEDMPSVNNFPSNVYGYGILLVFKSIDRAVSQIYIPHKIHSLCYRMTFDDGNSWTNWVGLINKVL